MSTPYGDPSGYESSDIEAAERRAYNRAMSEMREEVQRLQRRGDELHRELLSLDLRRQREVYAASERGRVYAAEIASRWATARAEALRNAAARVAEIDGRADDALVAWLNSLADESEGAS